MASALTARYEAIRRQLDSAARDGGREPAEIALLPVSKTFPAADIAELYAHGCRAFGESRIDELEQKAAALPPDIEWHFIGHVQTNKVRRVVALAAVIHSVDSLALLSRIDRIAGEARRVPQILLEVNISGEASKAGVAPDALPELAAAAAQLTHIQFKGLMTMAPAAATPAELDRVFGGLAARRDELQQALGIPLPVLSMGMSGDYPAAIRNGSTLVRIGSAIFGGRTYAGET